jgi:hypothetical protein
MALRCPVLSDEYIGSNSCSICRKERAKQQGYECPRVIDRWTVKISCFNLTQLSQKTRAETEAMFMPERGVVLSGDGTPDSTRIPAGA